jgi:hypothetical protein
MAQNPLSEHISHVDPYPRLIYTAEQSLAADGEIACFSSNFFASSLHGDRTPQLKASVRRLPQKLTKNLRPSLVAWSQ